MIIINPKILAGKPIIQGTRIPVTLIVNLIAHGYTPRKIIEAYPNLNLRQIREALNYAQKRLNREEIYPLKPIKTFRNEKTKIVA